MLLKAFFCGDCDPLRFSSLHKNHDFGNYGTPPVPWSNLGKGCGPRRIVFPRCRRQVRLHQQDGQGCDQTATHCSEVRRSSQGGCQEMIVYVVVVLLLALLVWWGALPPSREEGHFREAGRGR